MNELQFALGSASQPKIDAVERIVTSLTDRSFTVDGSDIASGVPGTPWDDEVKQGATNRAQVLAVTQVYAVGLESGLVERYGSVYEESWSCVIHDGRTYYGYSSGLQLPKYVSDKMSAMQLEHGPAMRSIRDELGVRNDKDTWGLYSSYTLLRTVSLDESLRNALIQIFAPEGNLYQK